TIDLKVDWRVCAFVLVLAFITGIGFGLIPALQATSLDIISAIKDNNAAAGFRRSRLRDLLVIVQFAVSLVLLIAAGLTVRSLQKQQLAGSGFETSHALALWVDLGLQGYDQSRGQQFYQQLSE